MTEQQVKMVAGREIVICGDWNQEGFVEFAGRGTIDSFGAVECSAELGGDAYDQIQEQVESGDTEGSVTVEEGGREVTYSWEIK